MKVRMLVDRPGSPDGIKVINYQVGEKYDMPESLAVPWLEAGHCEEDRVLDIPEETKAVTPKPKTRTKRRKK